MRYRSCREGKRLQKFKTLLGKAAWGLEVKDRDSKPDPLARMERVFGGHHKNNIAKAGLLISLWKCSPSDVPISGSGSTVSHTRNFNEPWFLSSTYLPGPTGHYILRTLSKLLNLPECQLRPGKIRDNNVCHPRLFKNLDNILLVLNANRNTNSHSREHNNTSETHCVGIRGAHVASQALHREHSKERGGFMISWSL